MPNLKTKLTTLTILTLGAANVYTASIAQQAGSEMTKPDLEGSAMIELAPTTADFFSAADLDGDAALNRDEYRVYIDTRAENGGDDASIISDDKSYSMAFARADQDGDGMVTYLEVTADPERSTEHESSVIDVPQEE